MPIIVMTPNDEVLLSMGKKVKGKGFAASLFISVQRQLPKAKKPS